MPAIDQCEPQIIRALAKAGWHILKRQYPLRLGWNRGAVFADLRLQRGTDQILVVEIKCFPEQLSQLEEFYHAVGQYMLYRNALKINNIQEPIYLAIPLTIYHTFFQVEAIQSTLEDAKIKLIVVNVDAEEIVAWVN